MTTVWALGDYPSVAGEVIPALGPVLVEACGAGPGMRVLDVAAGSGNAAIPAAFTGAEVTASDVTPELLDAGAKEAARRGVRVRWEEGDAQALQPPPLWGDPAHVTDLLGAGVTEIDARRQTLRVNAFATPESFRDFFKARYGPTVATYRRIAGNPERVAALDRDLAGLARSHDLGGGAMDWEYLLLTATAR
ncbi:class I SAM-dependent methyltransferase [Winogradskya consettensis]|nr:methyltransferase domain-containing protein [Actinoplanes consettensis]